MQQTSRMYSKEEEKEIRVEFWNQLNEKLELEKGFHKNKVNWMNFNTKIKQLFFRMEADSMGARLCIDLQFLDAGISALYYEQFTEFQNILEQRFETELNWYPKFEHWNGKTISRISLKLEDVNLYNKKDWPAMQNFLTDNFIKLEQFWSEFGEVFVNLKS